MFKLLDKGVLQFLADKLDDESLFFFCQTDKFIYEKISKDEAFWKRRLNGLEKFRGDEKTYHYFYLKMNYYIKKLWEDFNTKYIFETDRTDSPEKIYKTKKKIQEIMIEEFKIDLRDNWETNKFDLIDTQEKIISFNKDNIVIAVNLMYLEVDPENFRDYPTERRNHLYVNGIISELYSDEMEERYRNYLYAYLDEDID